MMGETPKTLVDIINGEMPAGIDGSFNLCDVRDLADGLIGAADKGKSGECYILGNEPVSFKDFTKLATCPDNVPGYAKKDIQRINFRFS